MKVIASIEDPVVIKEILDYLKEKAETKEPIPLSESRARSKPGCSTKENPAMNDRAVV